MTLINELKKPFNLITFILTIFSIFLSVYFYYKAEKEKGLSFNFVEPTSLIFDSEKSVPTIRIFEKDSTPIMQNIYLLTGTIWNTGDYPILKSDLRAPLQLIINNSNRILDFKINKQKDASIAGFSLNKINNSTLKVGWKYFDPNYGFKFQIIYVGDSISGFKVKGKILDIENFEKVEITKDSSPYIKYVLLGLFMIAFFYGIITGVRDYSRYSHNRLIKFLSAVLIIIPLIMVIYIILKYFLNNNLPEI